MRFIISNLFLKKWSLSARVVLTLRLFLTRVLVVQQTQYDIVLHYRDEDCTVKYSEPLFAAGWSANRRHDIGSRRHDY